MSAPSHMSNVNQGGYVPPGFGSGYPNAPSAPNAFQPEGYNQSPPAQGGPNYGFKPPHPGGYAPVPQAPPYGESQPPYVGGQPPYGGGQPPYGGQQPQYTGSHTPYSGQQPPYGGQQLSYGGYQPQYDAYGPQPIVTQPGVPHPGMSGPAGMAPAQPPTGEWMIMPVGIPNCPRGLEYLTTVDQLLVKQKVELLEAFIGFETNNKFTIKNALGQKVYYAVEDNDCCTRNMCGPMRPFDMKIFDNYKNEIMHMHRPLACDKCCFPCCLQSMEVSAPPGNKIGTIEQDWSICTPQFSIKNHLDDTVLRIEGPFCTFSMCGNVEFKIVSLTGETVGKISKQWSGLAREIFTDADFFGITFPLDLDVRMKAVLLGATFLIDAMFFEKQGNQETDRPGMF